MSKNIWLGQTATSHICNCLHLFFIKNYNRYFKLLNDVTSAQTTLILQFFTLCFIKIGFVFAKDQWRKDFIILHTKYIYIYSLVPP